MKKSQCENAAYCMIPITGHSEKINCEDRKYLVVAGGGVKWREREDREFSGQ